VATAPAPPPPRRPRGPGRVATASSLGRITFGIRSGLFVRARIVVTAGATARTRPRTRIAWLVVTLVGGAVAVAFGIVRRFVVACGGRVPGLPLVVESPIAGITSASFPVPCAGGVAFVVPTSVAGIGVTGLVISVLGPAFAVFGVTLAVLGVALAVLCATFVVEVFVDDLLYVGASSNGCARSRCGSAKRAAVSTSFSSTRSRPSSAASARAVRAVAMSPR